jgi:isopropylmalate/homocitrate/citramalate synthase
MMADADVPPAGFPRTVRVVEVGPRDGLQNEPGVVPVGEKVAFIEALAEAGLPVIEAGAFVRADRVPQMADSGEVFRRLRRRPATVYTALVPNLRGLERAAAAGARSVAVFAAASQAFARANLGMSIAESLRVFTEVTREAVRGGLTVRGYVSTAWWCPYSGRVNPDDVRTVAGDLIEMGCADVSIADTIGAATPAEVRSLLELLLRDIPAGRIGVHFHDTRGTALANVLASLELRIGTVDASAGGLGGCPFAPGALGNLATEDLLYMLHGMGVGTGVDLERVRAASIRMESVLRRPSPSRYVRAGPPGVRPAPASPA